MNITLLSHEQKKERRVLEEQDEVGNSKAQKLLVRVTLYNSPQLRSGQMAELGN